MTDYVSLIPVSVLTGFLGSGKTTLLRALLKSPRMRDTAVLINELGEVGLDHLLLEHAAESTVLLDNGCLCCAMRGDLRDSLRDLFSRRERGEVPRFERVVVETSGLADPVPIAYTILAEPVLQHHFRLGNVVTTVDAVTGLRQLEQHPESVKQAAVADRLVLTKTDLCDGTGSLRLREQLRRLNPAAPVFESALEPLDPGRLLLEDLYQPEARRREVERWLEESRPSPAARTPTGAPHGHDAGISSFCLVFEEALDWTAFGVWMTMLLNRHGEKVLRIKGMLNVVDVPGPVLINGVQHIVHPPTHLEAWPSGDRRSRIVFIIHQLSRERLEASLRAFNALADNGASPVPHTRRRQGKSRVSSASESVR